MKNKQYVGAVLLVSIGVLSRLIPHAANFVPITALTLVVASYTAKRVALMVPLGIMFISDSIIGLHPLILFTWGSLCMLSLLGVMVARRTKGHWKVALLAPVGSLIFFVVTNFGVWLQGTMYEHNVAGLMHCYVMGLPFLRTSFSADVLFTPLLFITVYLLIGLKQKSMLATKLDTKLFSNTGAL